MKKSILQLKTIVALLLILILFMMSGCATMGSSKANLTPEAESKLKKRLKMYARAMSVNDFNFTYSVESRDTRERISYEDYLRDKHASNAENEIYKISRIIYDKVRDEYIVKIKVVLVNIPFLKKLTISDMRGEVWKFEGDDWYRMGLTKRRKDPTKNVLAPEKKDAPADGPEVKIKRK